jgi:POT family proton-dependent oligopeptide transporter
MVGSLYSEGESARRDAGFSIFYMGINLGALIAPLIVGWLGQNVEWRYGFAAVTAGMILGLIQYRLGAGYLGDAGLIERTHSEEERAQQRRSLIIGLAILAATILVPIALQFSGMVAVTIEGIRNVVGVILLIMPLAYFGALFLTGGWTPEERNRIIAIIIFYVAAALFWSSFEQAGSTLNLFADRYTDNSVFGLAFPSTWWQSVNAAFIVLLAPVFGALWIWLSKRGKEPSTPMKFSLGLLFVGLGFLYLVPAGLSIEGGAEGSRVGVQWLLGVYFLHTVGELCLSPVGLSAMTKLAPKRIVGQMMGIWFLGAATGNFIGGNIGGLFETFPIDQIFLAVFGTSALAALLMLVGVKQIRKLMGGIH